MLNDASTTHSELSAITTSNPVLEVASPVFLKMASKETQEELEARLRLRLEVKPVVTRMVSSMTWFQTFWVTLAVKTTNPRSP